MLIETETRNIETKIRTFETENETETGLVTLTSLERTRSVFFRDHRMEFSCRIFTVYEIILFLCWKT